MDLATAMRSLDAAVHEALKVPGTSHFPRTPELPSELNGEINEEFGYKIRHVWTNDVETGRELHRVDALIDTGQPDLYFPETA